MEATQTTQATVKDVMASVGYLLLHWGYFETELEQSVSCLREHAPASSQRAMRRMQVKGKLAEWERLQLQIPDQNANHTAAVTELCKLVSKAIATRNAISHGLTGVSARPQEKEPYVLTKTNGIEVKHGLSELNRTINEIEAHRHALSRLTIAAIVNRAGR